MCKFALTLSNLFLTGLLVWGVSYNSNAQQANVNLEFDPQKDKEGLIPFSARLNSPEVHDDRTVTFRLQASEAKEVKLAGVALLTGLKKKINLFLLLKGKTGFGPLQLVRLRRICMPTIFILMVFRLPTQVTPMQHL